MASPYTALQRIITDAGCTKDESASYGDWVIDAPPGKTIDGLHAIVVAWWHMDDKDTIGDKMQAAWEIVRDAEQRMQNMEDCEEEDCEICGEEG